MFSKIYTCYIFFKVNEKIDYLLFLVFSILHQAARQDIKIIKIKKIKKPIQDRK